MKSILACLLPFCLAFAFPDLSCAQDADDGEGPQFEEVRPGAASVAFSPDGKLLAYGSDYEGSLHLYDLQAKQSSVLEEREATYISLSFSPDSRLLAVLRISLDPIENHVSVWDVKGRRRLWENKQGAQWAAFSPDGRAVAAGHHGVVPFFNPASGALLSELKAHHDSTVMAGAFSANGAVLATAAEDKQVKLWSVKNGKPLQTITAPDNVAFLALSRDGQQVAGVFSHKIFVWDGKTGRVKWSNEAHTDMVRAVLFTSNDRQIITGSHDGTARIWDAATGAAVTTFSPERSLINGLALSPDQSLLAVGASIAVPLIPLKPAAAATASTPAAAPEESWRAWTSADGKFTVEARLIEAKAGQVRLLRRDNQQEISVPLNRLSDEDRRHVAQSPGALTQKPSTHAISSRRVPIEPKELALTYAVKEHGWKASQAPLKLIPAQRGFCFLSGLSGSFSGYTERIECMVGPDGAWHAGGQAQQESVAAKFTAITNLKLALFAPAAQEFEWTVGAPAVKMLHKDEGICFLSSISGNFRGYGEGVGVQLRDDGYWWLEGHSAQAELGAKAIGLRWARAGAYTIDVQEQTWVAGGKAIELLEQDQGLCFLSTISGFLAGGGEVINLSLDKDGLWRLGGQSGQAELSAKALVIRIQAAR